MQFRRSWGARSLSGEELCLHTKTAPVNRGTSTIVYLILYQIRAECVKKYLLALAHFSGRDSLKGRIESELCHLRACRWSDGLRLFHFGGIRRSSKSQGPVLRACRWSDGLRLFHFGGIRRSSKSQGPVRIRLPKQICTNADVTFPFSQRTLKTLKVFVSRSRHKGFVGLNRRRILWVFSEGKTCSP
jgi:hypothetical protein